MINLQSAKKIGVRLDKILGALAVISVFCLIFIMSHLAIFDLDIWLHLKSGEIICQSRGVPFRDIFSFTQINKPWIDHEPLFQVLSYAVYRLFQPEGLILLSTYTIFFSFLVLFFITRKKLKSYFEVALLLFIAASASASRFNIRPDIFSVLFFSIYLYLLKFYSNKRTLWFIVPLQILWVNFHGYFFLGPLLIAIFILAEFIRKNFPKLPWDWKGESAISAKAYERLQAVFVLTLAASLINPNGLRGALYPAHVLLEVFGGKANIFFENIQELRATFGTYNSSWNSFYFTVLLALILLFVNFRKLKLVDILLMLVFLTLGLTQRNIVFLVFSSAMVISAYAAPGLGAIEERLKIKEARRGAVYYAVRNILTAIFIVWVWFKIDSVSTDTYYDFDSNKFLSQHIGVNEKHYPVKAVDFILNNDIKGNIFNDFNSGAYLIGRAYPERRVFIDGRTELYGPEFFKEYMDAMRQDEEALKRIEEKYSIGGVLLTGTSTDFPHLARLLYADKQWKVVFVDETAVLFLKENDANKGLIHKFAINLKNYSAPAADLKALGIRRIYPSPYIKRAQLFDLLQEDGAAESEAREALRIMPNCAEAYYILGKVALREGRTQEAFVDLRQGAVLMPRNIAIVTSLGEALIKLKEYKLAEKALLQALKLSAKYAPAHYQLSCLYIAMDSPELARKHLAEAKRYGLQDVELSQRVAQMEEELKK